MGAYLQQGLADPHHLQTTHEIATIAIFSMSDDTECEGADKVTLYEAIGGTGWRERHVKFCEAFVVSKLAPYPPSVSMGVKFRNQVSSTVVIFTSSGTIRDCENPPYDIPDLLSPEVSWDLSTGCKPTFRNSEHGEHVLHSYFSVWGHGTGAGAKRIETIVSALTIWQPRSNVGVVLYINIPLYVQKRLESRALARSGLGTAPMSSPCSWHIALTKEICGLYAHHARELENSIDVVGKEDMLSTNILQRIQVLAKDSSLLTAALDDAKVTMQNLREQISWHRDMHPVDLQGNVAFKSNESELLFLEHRIHCMELRSRTLERSVGNITAHASMALGMDAGRHSGTVTSFKAALTVVALVALPVTFFNGFFQMNFFGIRASDSGGVEWVVSPSLWVYWLVAGLLTLVPLMGWVTWHRVPGSLMVLLERCRPNVDRYKRKRSDSLRLDTPPIKRPHALRKDWNTRQSQ
ncbi:hypothetical protein BDV12DRAFT_197858 [Aspergillus spectabilis]